MYSSLDCLNSGSRAQLSANSYLRGTVEIVRRGGIENGEAYFLNKCVFKDMPHFRGATLLNECEVSRKSEFRYLQQ